MIENIYLRNFPVIKPPLNRFVLKDYKKLYSIGVNFNLLLLITGDPVKSKIISKVFYRIYRKIAVNILLI